MLENQITEPTQAESFRARLKYNKANSATIELDDKIKAIVTRILKGQISAREAEGIYNIDRETIKRKMNQLVKEDSSLLEDYMQYLDKSKKDYSEINFTGLLVHMINQNLSQSEIAEKYQLPARTVSRELNKLKNSEDEKELQLYDIAKKYAKRKMRREVITDTEIESYRHALDELFGEIEIINPNEVKKEGSKLHELETFLEMVEGYKEQKMTMAEISDKTGVSVSKITRDKFKIEELRNKEKFEQKEEGR